jgi:hypothetical protein
MPLPKYTVPGVPHGAQLSAFMPNANRAAGSGAQQYKGAVSGQPGITGVPAPTNATQMHPDTGDLAQSGTARSSDAPDVWYPQVWYQRGLTERPGAGRPIAVYSDNLLPVPARDPRGKPALLFKPILQRGFASVSQPRAIPSWGGPA